jgi:hypothetical protein
MELETKITPEKVMEILKENGTFVTHQEAEQILTLLTSLASISLNQKKDNEGRSVYPCEHG